jgi:hypothetical protein
VWELERTKFERPLEAMFTPFPSPDAPEPLRFSITGTIVTWEPFERWLRMGIRNFWLAPGVSVVDLAPGVKVTVKGHQDDLSGRWIVTGLSVP